MLLSKVVNEKIKSPESPKKCARYGCSDPVKLGCKFCDYHEWED